MPPPHRLGDTTTALQQAAALEAIKAELAAVSAPGGASTGQSAATAAAAATLEQLQVRGSRGRACTHARTLGYWC